VPANSQIVFDDDGRPHFAVLKPEPEPASLLDPRKAVETMLPRVDLPEVLPRCSRGPAPTRRSPPSPAARLRELHVTIAALLVAHSYNVGYTRPSALWTR
jgi:hypothetical protein